MCCVGRVKIDINLYEEIGVLPIWIVKSNVSSAALRQRETENRFKQMGLFI